MLLKPELKQAIALTKLERTGLEAAGGSMEMLRICHDTCF